jgi:hypothetical protein
MKNLLLILSVAVVACIPSSTQAGWWHHHHQQGYAVYQAPAYSAAPMYYSVPSQAAQSSPQQALIDSLLIKVLGKAIESVDHLEFNGKDKESNKVNPNISSVDLSGVMSDLSELKSGLKDLDGRVENVNSALRRQGEFMIALQGDINKLKDEFVETKPLMKTLSNVQAKLKGKTLEEIVAALDSKELGDELKDIIKDENVRKNALDEIKNKLKTKLAD